MTHPFPCTEEKAGEALLYSALGYPSIVSLEALAFSMAKTGHKLGQACSLLVFCQSPEVNDSPG